MNRVLTVASENGELCLDDSDGCQTAGLIPSELRRAYRSSSDKVGRARLRLDLVLGLRLLVDSQAYVFDIDGGQIQETFDTAKVKDGRGKSDEG